MNVEGIYKVKAVSGSEQWGPSSGGHPQCGIDFTIPNLGIRTVLLQFSEKSAAFSFDRLKAAGWDGKFLADGVPDLKSIGAKECFVQVKVEMFEGEQRIKCDIVLGRIEIAQFAPEDRAAIGQKLGALFKAPRPKPTRKNKSDGAPDDEFYGDSYEGP